MAIVPKERKSLLSSQARVQVPWIKVTIGAYTFGVFTKTTKQAKDGNEFYTAYNISYPNYIQSLNITKINGQVNQYTLVIKYPVRVEDDPNFFEKVFSSVSNTRKIVFSYGDASMPSYIYKDEQALITKVSQSFDLNSSVIQYTVNATSSAALGLSGSYTFVNSGLKKPSDEIKRIILDPQYGLNKLLSGMNSSNIDKLIAGDDKAVKLQTKTNISALDYINYLTGCMEPASSPKANRSKDIYILTLHDDTTYDKVYSDPEIINGKEIVGPYCKVTRTSYATTQSDAYVIDIGYNTSTIVTSFSIENQENYSLYYDFQADLNPAQYVRRINTKGQWEDVYAPAMTRNNPTYATRPEDIIWWTKVTKYPINATITVQGLLRPASLMSYVRLNVVFPGGRKHISSGLYIVTKQQDVIDERGYRTTLSLTKIDGDTQLK